MLVDIILRELLDTYLFDRAGWIQSDFRWQQLRVK
jgi:hypothetical protein